MRKLFLLFFFTFYTSVIFAQDLTDNFDSFEDEIKNLILQDKNAGRSKIIFKGYYNLLALEDPNSRLVHSEKMRLKFLNDSVFQLKRARSDLKMLYRLSGFIIPLV